jgi:hypothetical protein
MTSTLMMEAVHSSETSDLRRVLTTRSSGKRFRTLEETCCLCDFYLDDGSSIFLRNVGAFYPEDIGSAFLQQVAYLLNAGAKIRKKTPREKRMSVFRDLITESDR